jgi:hypothetical protein
MSFFGAPVALYFGLLSHVDGIFPHSYIILVKNFLSSWKKVPDYCAYDIKRDGHLKHIIPRSCRNRDWEVSNKIWNKIKEMKIPTTDEKLKS